MKVSDVLQLVMDDGRFLVAIRGCHRQFRHGGKPGRVTVAGRPGDDLAPGALDSILKQSGLNRLGGWHALRSDNGDVVLKSPGLGCQKADSP